MEAIGQMVALALIGAVLCLVIRGQNSAMGLLLSLCCCILIFLLSSGFLSPLIALVNQIRNFTGLSDALTAPMIKVVGVGLLTQFAGSVCEDSGEKALSKAVEVGGSILSLYISLPVIHAVIRMLEQLLGEHG